MNHTHRIMPYYKGGRFYNDSQESLKSLLLPMALLYLWGLISRGRGVPQLHAWHADTTPPQTIAHDPHAPVIQWIGHAGFLLYYQDITVITDPVFADLNFLFRRYTPPVITQETVPPIDVVLISHNHRDHLDRATLTALARAYNPLFLVPKGDAARLQSWGIARVKEALWWDQFTVASTSFTFLPTRHWSRYSLFDTNRSLWGSWMISTNDHHCYFGGDTAYGDHFRCIAQEFPTIHTALLPIGPCEPFNWLKASHMNAEQAGKAFIDLKAHTFIPMHWGTFGFGIDHPLLPLERITTWWNNAGLDHTQHQLIPLRIGQKLIKDKTSSSSKTSSALLPNSLIY